MEPLTPRPGSGLPRPRSRSRSRSSLAAVTFSLLVATTIVGTATTGISAAAPSNASAPSPATSSASATATATATATANFQQLPGTEVEIKAGTTTEPPVRIPAPPLPAVTTARSGATSTTFGPAATMSVTYDAGFLANLPARNAFQAAVNIWAAKVSSPVVINVNAQFTTSSCTGAPYAANVLGSAGPTTVAADFAGAPLAGVYYPAALANSLAGTDLDPARPDVCAAFNSAFSLGSGAYYFGTDGNPPFSDYDFMSVVLHELGHGLGFIGSMRLAPTAGEADCCFNGKAFAYDIKTTRGDGSTMLSLPHPSTTLLGALTSNDVFFRGPFTNAAAGAGGAKLYAPSPFEPGSSYAHLDEATYAPISGNALMTPKINNGEVEHDPGPITMGIFEDMGWQLVTSPPGAPTGAAATAGNAAATVAWTAPATNGGSPITGYTVTSSPGGQTCTWTSGPLNCTVSGLTNGTTYTFTVRALNALGQGPPSSPSNTVTPRSIPGAPTNALASAGNTQATIGWLAPASNGGSTITTYVVTASPSGLTCTWTAGPLSCTVTGLTNGVSHTFTVKASNVLGEGPASTPSNAVVPGTTTPPGAPSAAAATINKQLATVSWTAPISDGGSPITSYLVTSTPGSLTCTWTTGPLQCGVPALTGGTSYTFTVQALNAAGPGPASAPTNSVVPWSGSFYHPMDPTRILDSRTGVTGFNGPVGQGAGNTRNLTVTGGTVPVTASAVVLNVTATSGTDNSFLTVFPAGQSVPTASNLNFAAGQTIPNLITVQVGASGQITFFNAVGNVAVVGDIVGYYDDDLPAADRFTALDPVRILDSRVGPGFIGQVGPGAANARNLMVRGVATVPSSATAVVANITATGATANSFLSVFPSGTPVPTASNLNFAAGQTIANLAIIKIGATGMITFNNAAGAVDLVVDLVGYFDPTAGSLFHPSSPTRVLDSRTGLGNFNGPLLSTQTKSLSIGGTPAVPTGAGAVVMNTTVTSSTAASFLTVFPSGSPIPNASNLNFAAGQTIPNLTTVKLGISGQIAFFTAIGSTHVIADVVGYYSPF